MQQKARMTFRFDGTSPQETIRGFSGSGRQDTGGQPVKETGHEAAPDRETRAESGHGAHEWQAWQSPYQDDIHALEEIIRYPNRTRYGESAPLADREPKPVRDWPRAENRPSAGQDRKPADLRMPAGRERRQADIRPFSGRRHQPEDAVPAPAEELRSSAPYAREQAHRLKPASRRGEEAWPHPADLWEAEADGRHEADGRSGEAQEEAGAPYGLRNEFRFRDDRPSWWRVIASVGGAILTGGLFGYMLLSLFAGESLLPSGNRMEGGAGDALAAMAPADADHPSAPAQSASGNAASKEGNHSGASPAPASVLPAKEVPAFTAYMLQYGVFRSEDSMKEALAALNRQGVAAAADTTNGFRVFAGAAPTREDAERLATQLEGTQVYIKPVENVKLTFDGAAAEPDLPAFLEKSAALYMKLIGLTSKALMDAQPAAFGDGDVRTIETLRQAWSKTAAAAGSWNTEIREPAQSAAGHLNEALKSFGEYNRKPDRALLWSIQSSVISAALADRQLRMTVALESGS